MASSSLIETVVPVDIKCKFTTEDLNTAKESGEAVTSKCFYASNVPLVQYGVDINPQVMDEGENMGKACISFWTGNIPDTKIATNLIFSAHSARFTKHMSFQYDEKKEFTFPVCDAEDFFADEKKFIVNGEFNFHVKGTLTILHPPINQKIISFERRWKIKLAELEALRNSTTGSRLMTKRFDAGVLAMDMKYWFFLYPNGFNQESLGNTVLALQFDSEETKNIAIVCDFSIKSANFIKVFYNSCINSPFVHTTLVPTAELFDLSKKFITNDELLINIRGFFLLGNDADVTMSKPFVFNQTSPADSLVSSIIDETEEKDLGFTFIVEKRFQVTKQVLADTSTIFARIFEAGKEDFMRITNFSPEVVDAALKICHGSPLSQLSCEDWLAVYKFGEYFDMKVVKDSAETFLRQSISPANVCKLLQLSISLNIRNLEQNCREFFVNCSKDGTTVHGKDALDKDLLIELLDAIFASTVKSE